MEERFLCLAEQVGRLKQEKVELGAAVVLAEEVGRLKERNRALEAVVVQKDAEVAAAEEEASRAVARARAVEAIRACAEADRLAALLSALEVEGPAVANEGNGHGDDVEGYEQGSAQA